MDFLRLFDLFDYQAERFPNDHALNFFSEGKWTSFSTEDCRQLTIQVSAALLRLGVNEGDRVAIIARGGSPYWNFLDLGLQQIGALVVPIHAAILRDEMAYILNHASVRFCFTGTAALAAMVAHIQPELPHLESVLTIQSEGQRPSLLGLLRQPEEQELQAIQARKARIDDTALASIIYTSGTTGAPKGVMLTHRNIISNIKSIITLIPVNCEKRTVSYLPLTHIFERMVVYTYIAVGAAIFYADHPERLWENVRQVKPHFLTAVPLVLDRLYRQILQEAQKRGKIGKTLMLWAVELGKRYREGRLDPWYWFRLQLASLLVFRKWRQLLGGQIEGIVVGAAALTPELGRLFSAAGLEVREGYGLTETSPVVAFNRFEPGGVRFGTVGIPVPGVEVRINEPDEEGLGEILVRGPNVMQGYYQDEAATRKVLIDGWLHTGDLGKLVRKRFLQISGRRNDTFKSASGKFIVPQVLENELKISPFVDQAMVMGTNAPYVGALIVPDFSALEQWCLANNVHWTAPVYMVHNPRVLKLFQAELDGLNGRLPAFQQVKVFRLLPDPWTESSGELTPTMKIRRRFILEKFDKMVEEMFPKI